jgi:hypothetical protein
MTTEVSFKEEFCGYCSRPLIGSSRFTGHLSCLKQARIIQATKMANEGLIEKQVDPVEEYLKAHPDGPCVGRDGLTYNQRLAKQEQARKEVKLQNLRDRADRIRQLDLMERRLEALKVAVARDEADEREEGLGNGNDTS